MALEAVGPAGCVQVKMDHVLHSQRRPIWLIPEPIREKSLEVLNPRESSMTCLIEPIEIT